MSLNIAITYLINMLKLSWDLLNFVHLAIVTVIIVSFQEAIDLLQIEANIKPLMYIGIFTVVTQIFILFELGSKFLLNKKLKNKTACDLIGETVGETFGLLLYSFLISVLLLILPGFTLVVSLLIAPLILTSIKEYLTIGENLENYYGIKPYLFQLIDTIFVSLEQRYLKMTESFINNTGKSE